MYCIVKYSEVEKKESDTNEKEVKPIDHSKSSVDRTSSQRSEEIVKYKNEVKELFINPNCYTKILLDYVCEELKIDHNAEIDFCDEYGRLAKIGNLKCYEYATEALKSQVVYVVIVFQRGKTGKYKSIRPVLTKYSKLYADIAMCLRSQFSASSIYISERSSSSRSLIRSKEGDRRNSGSLRSKGTRKGSGSGSSARGLKNSLKSTRSSLKTGQGTLGVDSEVEIKTKGSKAILSKASKSSISPKDKTASKTKTKNKKSGK